MLETVSGGLTPASKGLRLQAKLGDGLDDAVEEVEVVHDVWDYGERPHVMPAGAIPRSSADSDVLQSQPSQTTFPSLLLKAQPHTSFNCLQVPWIPTTSRNNPQTKTQVDLNRAYHENRMLNVLATPSQETSTWTTPPRQSGPSTSLKRNGTTMSS